MPWSCCFLHHRWQLWPQSFQVWSQQTFVDCYCSNSFSFQWQGKWSGRWCCCGPSTCIGFGQAFLKASWTFLAPYISRSSYPLLPTLCRWYFLSFQQWAWNPTFPSISQFSTWGYKVHYRKKFNRTLAFLDVCISNKDPSCLITSVYHKKILHWTTHQFFQVASFSYKLALIRTPLDRAY